MRVLLKVLLSKLELEEIAHETICELFALTLRVKCSQTNQEVFNGKRRAHRTSSHQNRSPAVVITDVLRSKPTWHITSIIWPVYRAASFRHTELTTSANREEVWSVRRISPNSGNSVERSAWLERKKHKKVHYRERLFTASGAVSIYHLSAGVSASEGPRTAQLFGSINGIV